MALVHLTCLIALLALPAVAASAQPLTVIRNASIIDPAAAVPVTVGSIVISGDHIEAMGPAVAMPRSARIIDGTGKFVVPGLWDMHAHLAALTPIGRAPERYVGHGVLSLRDMGGFLDQLLPLRADIRAARRTGPELVLAGPTLNSERPAAFHRQVTTAAEARASVRELKAAGVDFIKIHRATSREVFDAVADETRLAGLSFSGHVPLVMSWADAASAGMRTIEHIQTVFENLQPDLRLTPALFEDYATRLEGPLGDGIFAALAAHGTYFDPTLVGYEATIAAARPEQAAARRQAYTRMKTIAAKAARSGVPIVTGTDVLDRHGDMLLLELERLVEIGMTPRQVLTAATVTSAAAAQRPDLGRLRAGGPASFLLVDRNPLSDITALRRLSTVVLRGRVLDRTALAALRR